MTATMLRPRPVVEPAARDHPTRSLGRWRLTQVSIAVAAASLPLLRPAGPGNTGLVDLAVVGAMLASSLWASTLSHRLRFPYALPVLLSVFAGALAVAAGHTGNGAAGRGVLALAQDVFVFVWAVVIATIGRDRQLLDTFCRAWSYSAIVWASALVLGEVAGAGWLTGITPTNGLRASLTLGDPNLAASYFVCSLFVIRAARRPRSGGLRWLACGLIVLATTLTLSNGGLLALFVATIAGALFGLAGRQRLPAAITAGVVLAVAGGVALATVDLQGWVTRAGQSSPFVRDSLGREAESSGSRTTLVKEGMALWLDEDPLLGVGPGNTEATLRARQAPLVKEAHDDYLAALLERGLLGGVALLLLVASVGIRSRRIAATNWVGRDYRSVVPRPELLSAAVLAVGLSAMFYEVLHFRHVWALLGLVAALEMSRHRR